MRLFLALFCLLLFGHTARAQTETCNGTPGDEGYFFSEIEITSPDDLAGVYTTGGMTNFGDVAWGDTTGLLPPGTFGDVAVVRSPPPEPGSHDDLGCAPLTNADEVAGRIALIQRGVCAFAEKALNAQMAGAVGFVIYQKDPPGKTPFTILNMGAAAGTGEQVVIPGVFVGRVLGRSIKSHIEDGGQPVRVTLRYAECYLPTVASEEHAAVEDGAVSAPYPNPFVGQTRFELALDRTQHITATVHDVLGRRVALLHEGVLVAGASHAFAFEARELPAGIYFVRFTGETFSETRRVVRTR